MADSVVRGAASIGRGGKLHPAQKNEQGFLHIICGCPGTASGSAQKRAAFRAGAAANCKRSAAYRSSEATRQIPPATLEDSMELLQKQRPDPVFDPVACEIPDDYYASHKYHF